MGSALVDALAILMILDCLEWYHFWIHYALASTISESLLRSFYYLVFVSATKDIRWMNIKLSSKIFDFAVSMLRLDRTGLACRVPCCCLQLGFVWRNLKLIEVWICPFREMRTTSCVNPLHSRIPYPVSPSSQRSARSPNLLQQQHVAITSTCDFWPPKKSQSKYQPSFKLNDSHQVFALSQCQSQNIRKKATGQQGIRKAVQGK